MVIDNMISGYDVYLHGNYNVKKVYPVPMTKSERYVKGVRFAESGTIFVGGSDHGCAYLYEVASGQVRQTLKHGGSHELLQIITVRL